MEEQFIVKSSHDLKTELKNRYKTARERIDRGAIELRYKKILEEKEKQVEKELQENKNRLILISFFEEINQNMKYPIPTYKKI